MFSDIFINALRKKGIGFFSGVPDSYLHGFCSGLRDAIPKRNNVIAANEGNAISIAAGHYLATGKLPLVYMQNSGLGNAINPLVSMAGSNMLGIPMVILVGWRGDPLHPDHVQHELQGNITPDLFELMDIPFFVLNKNVD